MSKKKTAAKPKPAKKPAAKSGKSRAGRKSTRTPAIEAKLEQAFSFGATIVSACYYAGIGESTYHDWAKADPEFSERMKAHREKPVLKALQTVVGDLGNPHTAKWYLEKRHDDFKPRQVVDHKGLPPVSGVTLQLVGGPGDSD